MGKWRDVFGPDRRRPRSSGKVRDPRATILDIDPGSVVYAAKLRRLRRKEQRLGTPGLTAIERRFVRRERESEKTMTDLEQAVFALERKSVTFRGARMSKAQRRAIGIGKSGANAWHSPLGGTMFTRDASKLPPGAGVQGVRTGLRTLQSNSGGHVSFQRPNVTALPGLPGAMPLGGKAKRSSGQAARAKRLKAAGVGAAKPSKRMQQMQRVRSDLTSARRNARSFIDMARPT